MDDAGDDQYLDLEELSDPSSSSFEHAANHLKSLVSKLDDRTLLALYGYYKQGTEGPCDVPKPSWYDVRAKSKWDAWKRLGDMPRGEAQALYVETVKRIDPDYDGETGSGHGNKVSSLMADDGAAVPPDEMTVVDHVRRGDVPDVERHIAAGGVAVDALDELGLGLIHWAADGGRVDVIGALLGAGADVNLRDGEGQTALHYASSCGHVDCVKYLLGRGADRDIADNDGCKPIDVASDEEVRVSLS